MNRKTILFGFTAGLLFANGIFANDPIMEKDGFDINSIVYIEDDTEFDLGFDTADYLPEDFDAHQFYFNINSVEFIEEEYMVGQDLQKFLPEGFDPYAYPTDVQSINYIDENDWFEFKMNDLPYIRSNYNPKTSLSK